MTRVSPWHSIFSPVYHNDTACSLGQNIEPQHRREGTGEKRICPECKYLDEQHHRVSPE